MGLCDRALSCHSAPDEGAAAAPNNIEDGYQKHEKKEPTAETPLDDKKQRIQWSSPTEFLLTCIGYSVGLGNVWRFPYLCYKNGGGAFLIPYGLMILFIGTPLLFMEYSFGQYFGIGSLSIFKQVCPLLQGIGIGYSILNALVSIYYNIIIAISLYYIFGSLTSNLPWASCDNPWNTEDCREQPDSPSDGNSTLNLTDFQQNFTNTSFVRTSPSDEFFRLELMAEESDSSIGNLGSVRWRLCLCLLLAWILVAIFVSRGIKSSGKVAYFTATFPYVMLTVLVVKGVTLPGAMGGVMYFLVPDWNRLLSPDVWFHAATQLFYSLNLAWGGMITMSSYNDRKHNCYRDAIVINLVSFATSLYAGIAVFAIIGFMANEYNLPVNEVVKSGPALAFVAYPRALSLMPIAPLWTSLFFFMLFLLGIGSQMVCVETIITGIMDNWSFLVRRWQYRVAAIFVIAMVGFLLGIPCTTQGGMYVLQLMDHYSAGFCVLVIAIFECLAINWIYGSKKMIGHVAMMLGRPLNIWWRISWKFISPFLIVVILIFSFVRYNPVVYGDKTYPIWADAIGWMLTLASNIPIVVVALIVFAKAKGNTFIQKWRNAIRPKIDEESERRETFDFKTTRDIGHDDMLESGRTLDGANSHLMSAIEVSVPLRTLSDGLEITPAHV